MVAFQCHMTKWISYMHLPISLPFLGFPDSPPNPPSRLLRSTKLSSLHCTAGSHQLSTLYMVMHSRELSCTVGEHVNWYSHDGKRHGSSLKNWKIGPPSGPASWYWTHTLRISKFRRTRAPPCSLQHCLQKSLLQGCSKEVLLYHFLFAS